MSRFLTTNRNIELLEPYEGKLSRTVLRGEGGSNALDLPDTIICTFLSGLIIASAFSSIVVYATDLMPDKVGLIAGIFFGLMFGLGGLGSAFFGWLADKTSIEFIFQVSAFLPLLGIIAGFLPNTQSTKNCS